MDHGIILRFPYRTEGANAISEWQSLMFDNKLMIFLIIFNTADDTVWLLLEILLSPTLNIVGTI